MDEKKIIEIIEQLRSKSREWKTVDAKKELTLKENGDKAEFVKDVAAMANNFEKSYLVIGLNDGSFSDVGKLTTHYTKNDINQILSGNIDPPVIVDYKEFNINSNEYGLIEILGENPPYIIARDITSNQNDRKRNRIYKGTIFVRHEDRTEGISRSELEEILSKGLRGIFKDENERVKKLVEKPDYWEYLLTAELLKSKMNIIKKELSEIERGAFFKKSKKIKGQDFINLTQSHLNDLSTIAEILTKRMNVDLLDSWGQPGESGDALKIKETTDNIFLLCRELLEWETELRSIHPPNSFNHLKDLMLGWASHIITSIENIHQKLFDLFEDPKLEGHFTIEIKIDAPPNMDKFNKEINRLKSNPKLWKDDFN